MWRYASELEERLFARRPTSDWDADRFKETAGIRYYACTAVWMSTEVLYLVLVPSSSTASVETTGNGIQCYIMIQPELCAQPTLA